MFFKQQPIAVAMVRADTGCRRYYRYQCCYVFLCINVKWGVQDSKCSRHNNVLLLIGLTGYLRMSTKTNSLVCTACERCWTDCTGDCHPLHSSHSMGSSSGSFPTLPPQRASTLPCRARCCPHAHPFVPIVLDYVFGIVC